MTHLNELVLHNIGYLFLHIFISNTIQSYRRIGGDHFGHVMGISVTYIYILNKSENATPEFVCHLCTKLCKPRTQLKVYLNVQILDNA